ncbi:alpha/beta fold hydrolase [Magnetovibrio sp.]|uniref:alpha/beta fold hydrolase n=1 Tax=Magnetovibrio sp. TaxID=2024836 RepID=UPI002F928E73
MSVQLSYQDLGSGEPIVILHGLFGSKRNWSAIAKRLSAHNRVLTVDMRNHGESPWIDGMDYRDMSADVADFIKRHALGSCTVIGHSMGGKAAMTLALTHPELVARLVVVDIAPVERETGFGAYIEAMAEVPLAMCDSRNDIEEHLADVVRDKMVRSFLVQNVVREETGFRWRINLAALDAGMDQIADFPAPDHHQSYNNRTLFVAGARSDYIQPHHLADITRLFPKADIAHIPDAGHWLHAEAPEVFLRELTAFLGA